MISGDLVTYVTTYWHEGGMSEAQKLTALNNMETQYDEAITLFSAHVHTDRYYTEAQCNGGFFTPANDGAGSGLVCETLDGYTAQQIIDAGVPSKGVGWWYGTEESVPSGWAICNGYSGTRNLIDRMLVGVGSAYSVGDQGGIASVTPTSASLEIGTHALVVSELPSHTHDYTDWYNNAGGAMGGDNNSPRNGPVAHNDITTDAGASNAHGHPGSTFSGYAATNLPQYTALLPIMRLVI